MSARENLVRWIESLQIIAGHDDNPGESGRAGYAETRRAMLDPVYAEVRAEAIGHAIARLCAIPVDCTALTGPVWYGAGWKDCITALRDIADFQLPKGEAYPGELQRLRARMRELRAAALRREDLGRVQQVLMAHAAYEAEVASKTGGDGS